MDLRVRPFEPASLRRAENRLPLSREPKALFWFAPTAC